MDVDDDFIDTSTSAVNVTVEPQRGSTSRRWRKSKRGCSPSPARACTATTALRSARWVTLNPSCSRTTRRRSLTTGLTLAWILNVRNVTEVSNTANDTLHAFIEPESVRDSPQDG